MSDSNLNKLQNSFKKNIAFKHILKKSNMISLCRFSRI